MCLIIVVTYGCLELSGLPDYKYPSLDQNDIMAELEKKYPDFEKRTGWRFESAYTKEIPEDLAKEVLIGCANAFFAARCVYDAREFIEAVGFKEHFQPVEHVDKQNKTASEFSWLLLLLLQS